MLNFKRIRQTNPTARSLPPGTLHYTGPASSEAVRIRVYDYDDQHLEETELETGAAVGAYRDADTVSWIDVDGIHDVEILREIGTSFGVHDLTLEDILHTHQRPKMEEYEGYVFVVLQMLHYDHESAELHPEQVSLIFGKGFVISFQETMEGDAFEPVRAWLREHRGRIRRSGADYLAYALIDVIVDQYMAVLEGLGEHIEALEDVVASEPHPEMMQQINAMRRRIMTLRRSIWPLRDVASALERSELPFIAAETDHYFRDVYDHAIRAAEMTEAAREILSSLGDIHLSALSFRMNDIMKMLAVIATFFLPLSFIASVYGMNFDPAASPLNMPELEWYFGYPFALTLMSGVALTMFVFFRRRGWL
ncbi:MAG: magnesium/cobalt transporter CorA [Rhodothermales bacterium]